MSIAKNVKYLREKMGISQAELGRAIKKTTPAINKVELGMTKNPRYLKELADFFGVSELELRFGEFEETKKPLKKDNDDYGMRLIEARTEKGMSREDLSKKIKISTDYLANIERANIELTIDFIKKVAHAGLDVNYILTGTRVNQTTASNHNTSNINVNGNSMGDGNNISIGNYDNNQE